MATHNLEVSTENLLGAVSQMSEKEFNRFVEEAKKLRAKPTKSRWSKSEIELIRKINGCVFSDEEQNRFDELVEKRRDEKISESELEELIALSGKSEALNVERLKIIAKLATSKNKTLSEIMDELEIHPPKVI
jgi:hypothetical protein